MQQPLNHLIHFAPATRPQGHCRLLRTAGVTHFSPKTPESSNKFHLQAWELKRLAKAAAVHDTDEFSTEDFGLQVGDV